MPWLILRQPAYALFNTSASTAKMVHKGLKTFIGAHGEPPLGVNYHAEMFFAKAGGLSNYEVGTPCNDAVTRMPTSSLSLGYSRSYVRRCQGTWTLQRYRLPHAWQTRRFRRVSA